MKAFSNQFVIVRVAGDQGFFVHKRHSWNIFEQVVTVAYLKKNQILLETNCAEVSFFHKVACLRVFNFFVKTVNSFRYGSKYVSEPQT